MDHTPGARTVASIILNGKDRIETAYGVKTAEGLADLIDREMAAPDLLEAAKAVTKTLLALKGTWEGPGYGVDMLNRGMEILDAAIAKTTEGRE